MRAKDKMRGFFASLRMTGAVWGVGCFRRGGERADIQYGEFCMDRMEEGFVGESFVGWWS